MVMVAFVMRVVTVSVSATFGLESCPHFLKLRSKTAEHVFDHMVRSDEKKIPANFSRQVAIAQVPSQSRQFDSVLVSNFDKILWRSLDL